MSEIVLAIEVYFLHSTMISLSVQTKKNDIPPGEGFKHLTLHGQFKYNKELHFYSWFLNDNYIAYGCKECSPPKILMTQLQFLNDSILAIHAYMNEGSNNLFIL